MNNEKESSAPKISRHMRHDHFWIEDEELYESYKTIRGLRWRYYMHVPGMADCDKCTEDNIRHIETVYLPTLKS